MSVEISVMTYGNPLWDKTISFADNCSGKAGSYDNTDIPLEKMIDEINLNNYKVL